MSKKQFTLDSWLKDKSQKVVTRCGFPVRIVCTDVKRKDYPILALVERDDQEEYQSFTKDGRFSLYNPLHDNFDLFIETADEVCEDEKVRKALLEMVHDTTGDELLVDYHVHKEEALTWLERQGEHANFRYKIQVGDKVTRNEAGVLVNISQLRRVAKPSEKQCEQKFEMKTAEESLDIDSDTYNKIVDECIFGEQKPKENKGNVGGISPNWSEEDKGIIEEVVSYLINYSNIVESKEDADRIEYLIDKIQDICPHQKQEWSEEEIEPIISDYLCGREHYGGMIGRLCHLKPKQKQTEWSENDKAFLDDILCKLEHDLILNKDEKDWLKSLRPQSKQEWREEDEQHIDSLLKRLDALCRNKFERTRFAISEDRDWLKSLRPQNRWKPNDEQIAQLQIAVDTYGNEGIYDPILTELLFQLKKLKEG